MREALRHVAEGENLNHLPQNEKQLLMDCYDAGYFEGVMPIKMVSGRIVFEVQSPYRLTVVGLRFLEPPEEPSDTVEQAGKVLSSANDLVSVLEKVSLAGMRIFKFFKDLL